VAEASRIQELEFCILTPEFFMKIAPHKARLGVAELRPPLRLHEKMEGRAPASPVSCRRAFTLIELLLVIAIIGVLVAVILPQFNVGMSGVKVRTAALGYMQTARYARTMALLYQVEIEIVCETGGVIRVEAGPLRGEGHGPYVAPEDASGVPPEGGAPSRLLSLSQPGRPAASNSNPRLLSLPAAGASAFDQSGAGAFVERYTPADVSAEELASEGDVTEAIRVEQAFEGVHVQFLEYTDEDTSGTTAAEAGATESFRVRYRSNGTCRPYRVRISDDAGTTLVLDVDMLGMTVIEGEGSE
jgi:prepilin-type N-terminal cleavage/methylation domain-containing protein